MEKLNAWEESGKCIYCEQYLNADVQLLSYLFTTQPYFHCIEEASMNKTHKCHSLSKYL